MGSPQRRMACVTALLAIVVCGNPARAGAQAGDRLGLSGEQLYQRACVACHGADGRGQPIALRGFELEPPDFTDCSLTTPEADLDWDSIIHVGGPVRAFNQLMPSFRDELSDEEIGKLIEYLRGFCSEPRWPRGDLNLPRAFVTEKAFPENEAVLTTTIVPSHEPSVSNEFLYEHRIGRRGQYEVNVPISLQQSTDGAWSSGLGDVSAAYKHVLFDSLPRGSIVSAGGEIKFPTGKESEGLGGGVTVVEGFGTFSQMLPSDGFLHAHVGVEVPSNREVAPKETFWRLAAGKSFMEGRWGRAWSPMVELLGARELVPDTESEWDVLPQIQVSLSTRQHVLLNVGVRVPVNERESRSRSVLVYLLWDWFDGGLFSGW